MRSADQFLGTQFAALHENPLAVQVCCQHVDRAYICCGIIDVRCLAQDGVKGPSDETGSPATTWASLVAAALLQ